MKIRSRLGVAILCAVAIISTYAEGVLDYYWIGLFQCTLRRRAVWACLDWSLFAGACVTVSSDTWICHLG